MSLELIQFVMPSTRKQKARDKRSKQTEVMSDVENDVMLKTFPKNYFVNELENEQVENDSTSARLHKNPNTIGEDFRSLVNSNTRGNSEKRRN